MNSAEPLKQYLWFLYYMHMWANCIYNYICSNNQWWD